MKAPVKKSATVKKPAIKAKPAPAKKLAAKPVPKSAAKPSNVKPVAKNAVAKSVAPAKSAAKKVVTPAKAAAKPAVKAPAKPAVKPGQKAKIPVKTKPALAKLAKPVSITKSATAKAAPAKVAVKASAKPVALPASRAVTAPQPPMVASAVPTKTVKTSKSGFISPGNIAPRSTEVSTAAKTHFTMSTPVLAPPPPLVVKKDAKLANNWKTKTAEQLTDAEAIAMPDAEYMSSLQMAFFRLKLVQLKKDILSNAGETTEHLREDTAVVPDPADRATIEEEHALELRTRDRERKLLKKIEQSIMRIDSGDYGYCDETGEPIGVGRLIARPTATLSIEAQQRRELKQKMFGD